MLLLLLIVLLHLLVLLVVLFTLRSEACQPTVEQSKHPQDQQNSGLSVFIGERLQQVKVVLC